MLRVRRNKLHVYAFYLNKNRCALAESVKRSKFCMTILHHIFYMMSYEKNAVLKKKRIFSKIPNLLASVRFQGVVNFFKLDL